MELHERIDQLKLENTPVDQATVRISKQHKKKVRERIKKHHLKEGQYLRALLEDAIERESKVGPIPFKNTFALFSKDEFDAMKKEVKQLKEKMNGLEKLLANSKTPAPDQEAGQREK